MPMEHTGKKPLHADGIPGYDNNNWHMWNRHLPTTFSSPISAGSICCTRSNPFHSFATGWETDKVKLENGDVSVYCSDWLVQMQTGQMPYTVARDGYPNSAEVTVEYDLSKYLDIADKQVLDNVSRELIYHYYVLKKKAPHTSDAGPPL